MKLLIVDPDRDLVEMLMSWLKTLGYDAYRAYSGEQARGVWLEEQPDLVIIDNILKDIDALTLCRDMRSKHDALVIVVTDRIDRHVQVRCMASGAEYSVLKPFVPSQLLAHIHAVS